MKNYYEILEVNPRASEEVIKKAHQVLIKKYHPDLYVGVEREKAEENTKEIEIIRSLNKYIQENSEEEILNNKKYQVLFAGNHKYWSVGPWDKTRFLNRNWDYKEPNGNINRTITESKKGS